jgi:protein gp37
MSASKIEWTDRSDWNPVRGCTRVSPGCGGPGDNGGCYAEAMAARFSLPGMWGHGFAEMRDGKPRWTGKVEFQEDRLTLPLRWRKPAKIFVSSTSDIFHESLVDEAIHKVFAVMALCPQHTFQVLTKRAVRMRDYFLRHLVDDMIPPIIMDLAAAVGKLPEKVADYPPWPLPNVWLGISAERQKEADERIPLLLQTPAAIRFISAEPLLGPIDFRKVPSFNRVNLDLNHWWVIVGGESGKDARPMHPQWARDIRDQCSAAAVPFFFKQWGEWIARANPDKDSVFQAMDFVRVGKKAAGRLLDGVEHNGFPERKS